MTRRFLTFSVALLFALGSTTTAVYTHDEPHKRLNSVEEILNRKDEEEDEDE